MLPARVKASPRHSTILPSMWRTHSDLGLAAWRLPPVSAGLQLDGSDVGSHSGASRCGSSLRSPSASLARLSRERGPARIFIEIPCRRRLKLRYQMCHHDFCKFWVVWVLRVFSTAWFATVEGVNPAFMGSTPLRDMRSSCCG